MPRFLKSTKNNSRNILAGLLMGTLLLAPIQTAFASSYAHDRLAELVTNVQVSGEYVLGAYYSESSIDGELQMFIETTEGKKVFNGSGELTESYDRQGNKTVYENGVPVKVLSPDGKVISETDIKQEKTGSKWITSQDQYGLSEKRRLNSKGEMIERVDKSGNAFSYKIHKGSNGKTSGITEVNQLDGTQITRFFDPKTGDINRMIDQQGSEIRIEYVKDDKGRKLRSIEKNLATGQVTEKTFDSEGRETAIIVNGQEKAIAYETDQQGNITASVETINEYGEHYQVRKEFDKANRVTSESDSRGKETRFTYVIGDNNRVSQVKEEETITSELGVVIRNTRTKIMGDDGRIKTLLENGFTTDYTYNVDEQGRVKSVTEIKAIAGSMEKLHTMTTTMDSKGQPQSAEKWEELGPLGKRHSTTTYVNDPVTNKVKQTISVNDLGGTTKTFMNEKGHAVKTETWESHGPLLKRFSVSTIKTDRITGQPISSETINGLGDRTFTTMDEHGRPVKSENWTTMGANLKKHSITDMQIDPMTGKPVQSTTVNDRGDITKTYMDKNGLPVRNEVVDQYGALLGREKISEIENNPVTGITQRVDTKNELMRSTTIMDSDGLPVSSESWEIYGATLKRHKVATMTNDSTTGLTKSSESINDRNDRTVTHMDENGLAVRSESWLSLGATLKQHSVSEITVNQDTGETQKVETINDRNDRTVTDMDKNGLAVRSESWLAYGALLKRHSISMIKSNPDTGIAMEMTNVNAREDKTMTWMDENGLAVRSESWLAYGALLKRHSETTITTDVDTGETKETESINDLGDRTVSHMNKHGLVQKSESWQVLGATLKRHSKTRIQVNPATGETMRTFTVNDRQDITRTRMDENGLPVMSDTQLALGAMLKRHSLSQIHVNQETGETRLTKNVNDRGDRTISEMDENGFAKRSESWLALGATLKRHSSADMKVNQRTGQTMESTSINDRGDRTKSEMDENGLAVRSESWLALGAKLKRNSVSTIVTDQQTGETKRTESVNARKDRTLSTMDKNGLAVKSESWLAFGAKLKKHSNTTIHTNQMTGETDSTVSINDRKDKTFTEMNNHGLPVRSISQLQYGAELKKVSTTQMLCDQATGEMSESFNVNKRGDKSRTWMDTNGLAVKSESIAALGAFGKRRSLSTIVCDQNTGETIFTRNKNTLGDVSETYMDENGLAYYSTGKQVAGANLKKNSQTQITTDPNTGETVTSININELGDTSQTWMDEDGLAVKSESVQVLGAKAKRHSTTKITTNRLTGEAQESYTVNALGDESWTSMDGDGLARASFNKDALGAEDGREKTTTIIPDRTTGITRMTLSYDKMHVGPVLTQMDEDGLPVVSEGVDRYGPRAGTRKNTRMISDPNTGITQETMTYDQLHVGPTTTIMDKNGLAVESTSVTKYGPSGARHQSTKMIPDEMTGLTKETYSETTSGSGLVVSKTRTINDPVYGTPVSATAISTFGAYREKKTLFGVSKKNGLTMRSVVEDDGGVTTNEHSEFGIVRSERENLLGAIKKVATANELNTETGIVKKSISTDRKGKTVNQFNTNGMSTVSTRVNTGASYVPTETTRVQSWNNYTGSPLKSVSSDGHGKTIKNFDLDGFMTDSIRTENGDKTITTYENNPLTGLPVHSYGQGVTGDTETWYEMNGLSLTSKFNARIGLHNTTTYFYEDDLDMASTKSVDERGNVTASVFNNAGEVTHTYSKNGTTTMDLKNNRAAKSSGPGGSTTYYYSGKWLDKTVSSGKKGTTTSWMDHRHNGAANKVKTKDGTTSYGNRYNSRGFVTYRTESNGKDKGYSNFNNYGDQTYTKWSGKIPAGKKDKAGNYYMGGSWTSETTYKNNSRGDCLSWTTKTKSKGKVFYAEVGHYEVDEETGEESWVVDQEQKVKSVGETKTKTETPDYSPKSDGWVLAHLKGYGMIDQQYVRKAGTSTTNIAEELSDENAAAISELKRNANDPGYHSVYQKEIALANLSVTMADSLQEQFKPVVDKMNLYLKAFAETGNLLYLKSVISYNMDDINNFYAGLKAAPKKDAYIANLVSASYYRFSGKTLDVASAFGNQSIQQSLHLVGLGADEKSLVNWIKFVASKEDQKTLKEMVLSAQSEIQLIDDDAKKADILDSLKTKLVNSLGYIARNNMNVQLSSLTIKPWLDQTLEKLDDLTELAGQMEGMSGSVYSAQAVGVSLGSATMDDQLLSGVGGQAVTGAAVQDQPGQVPGSEKFKQDDEIKLGKIISKPAGKKARGFGKIARTYELQLKREMRQPGKKRGNKKGQLVRNTLPDGTVKTFKYKDQKTVIVKTTDEKGQVQSAGMYLNGKLRKVAMRGGMKIFVKFNKKDKTIEVAVKSGSKAKVFKFNQNGKLESVLEKEGKRVKVVEEEDGKKEADQIMDLLSDKDDDQDLKLDGNRIQNNQVPENKKQ